jgi:hypothetical protein
MNPKLLAAFDQHAAATFDKQSCLNELVGELDWQFEMDSGLLSFGDRHQWQAQILGTQSDESGTWLWAWANEASGIPENLLVAANALRKLGTAKGIAELTEAQLPADEYDGHFWSILATGVCKADAYYRGPYEGGAVFLLIEDPAFDRQVDNPLLRFATIMPQAVSAYPISNHKRAVAGYADFLGLTAEAQGDTVVVADGSGNQLTAEFDGQNRLTKLAGELS